MAENKFGQTRADSALWSDAIERYREELGDDDDYAAIANASSLDELMDYAKALQPLAPIRRLKPSLKFVEDFSATLTLCFGVDAGITAPVWGSIRLMLTLASPAVDTLRDVLVMLEELSLTLPRFRCYEDDTPLNRTLESAVVDVYAEVICFYARCIRFFRAHPHVLMRREAWSDFQNGFSRTERRVELLSSTVKIEAKAARMEQDRAKYSEALKLVKTSRKAKLDQEKASLCYYVPSELGPGFWGRDDALAAIQRVLAPEEKQRSLKVFTLHGMGGVGKTQIALQFATKHRHQYAAVMWVNAGNPVSLSESFREIARVLGLLQGDGEIQESTAAQLKVKAWLNNSTYPWLMIFDNVDEVDHLWHVWPANGLGSILLTTRDFGAADSLDSLSYRVQPFDDTVGSEVLLRLADLDTESPSNQANARNITRALGGLPLAINQIGGFIVQRRLPIQDFLPLYDRNAANIDARKTGLSGYEHTLSTVWEVALTKLSGDSRSLLNLLAYAQPDAIDEAILLKGSDSLDEPDLEFLGDYMDLGDAEEILLRLGLIDKTLDTAILSIHRLIQATVVRSQSQETRRQYFDATVRLLSWGFSNTWSEDAGHQIQSWSNSEKCLPHVLHLMERRDKYGISVIDTQKYGELLLRCAWYLYERKQYGLAKRLANTALDTFEDKNTSAFASAVGSAGLVGLDANESMDTTASLEQALKIRETSVGPADRLIASSLNKVASIY